MKPTRRGDSSAAKMQTAQAERGLRTALLLAVYLPLNSSSPAETPFVLVAPVTQ